MDTRYGKRCPGCNRHIKKKAFMCEKCWFGRVDKDLRRAIYRTWNAYQAATEDEWTEWIDMELARLEFQEMADRAIELAVAGQETAA